MRTVRIVIVNYRTPELVIDCLRSLVDEVRAEPGCRVTVVDNASGDESSNRITATIQANGWSSWVEFLALDHNGGFAFGNNAAIRPLLRRPGAPDFFHLLNPDTVVQSGAVSTLLDFMEAHPRAGIAGGRVLAASSKSAASVDGTSTVAAAGNTVIELLRAHCARISDRIPRARAGHLPAARDYLRQLRPCSACLTSGTTSRPNVITSSSSGQPDIMNCVTPIALYARSASAISAGVPRSVVHTGP